MRCRWIWRWLRRWRSCSRCGGSAKPPPEAATPRAAPTPDRRRVDRRALARPGALLPPDPRADGRRQRRRTGPTSCARRSFDAQLQALDDAGYTPITGDALRRPHGARGEAAAQADPADLRRRVGGQYTRALPILRKHHFVATFFVMTVVLGKPGWLTRGPGEGARPRGDDDRARTPTTTRRSRSTPARTATRSWPSRAASCAGSSATAVELFAYPFGAYSCGRDRADVRARATGPRSSSPRRLDRQHPLWSIRRIIVPRARRGRAAPARDPRRLV